MKNGSYKKSPLGTSVKISSARYKTRLVSPELHWWSVGWKRCVRLQKFTNILVVSISNPYFRRPFGDVGSRIRFVLAGHDLYSSPEHRRHFSASLSPPGSVISRLADFTKIYKNFTKILWIFVKLVTTEKWELQKIPARNLCKNTKRS